MSGSLYSEWRQCWYNNPSKTFEFANQPLTAVGVGFESEEFDIPNRGMPIFGIRLRFNGALTTNGNAVALATNLPSRAVGVRIRRPDGKYLVNLSANGGIAVHTAGWGVNDVINPGDIRMYAEPFIGDAMDRQDSCSGRLGPQTAAGVMHFEIFIPVFIPQDAGVHKIQIVNSNFTWGVAGTVYAANPANVTASVWNVEFIEECLPVGATMSYFECTGPQTIALAVGDNFIGNRLNRNKILKALLIHSPLPQNVDQVDFLQSGNPMLNTEYEDAVYRTMAIHPDMGIFKTGLNYGLDLFTVLAILRAPFKNLAIVEPGDLLVTDDTQLNITLLNAAQNIRIMQLTLATLTRRAVITEVEATQPAPASPVVAVRPSYPQRVENETPLNAAGTTIRNAAARIFRR